MCVPSCHSIASFAIVAAPAIAERLTRDGTTYTYEVTSRPGYRVISGTTDKSGDAFRPVVMGDRVAGEFGGKPIQFRVSSVLTAEAAEAPILVAAK